MSPENRPTRPRSRPSPVSGTGPDTDLIEIRPQQATRSSAPHEPGVDPQEEIVVLGRFVPLDASRVPAAARLVGNPTEAAAIGSPIVDNGGLHRLLVSRRERYSSAPRPPLFRHRGWTLSSVVIAGGGVAAVQIAGDVGQVPLVATIALVATVLCGAILVAAQLVEEVRRARRGRPSSGSAATR